MYTTAYNRFNRSSRQGIGGNIGPATGRSRGGRTTKLHGLADDRGRPRVLLLAEQDAEAVIPSTTA